MHLQVLWGCLHLAVVHPRHGLRPSALEFYHNCPHYGTTSSRHISTSILRPTFRKDISHVSSSLSIKIEEENVLDLSVDEE